VYIVEKGWHLWATIYIVTRTQTCEVPDVLVTSVKRSSSHWAGCNQSTNSA